MTVTALVTGASGGLGQALARELRQDGWTMALVGHDRERLQAAFGLDGPCIAADVSTPEGARAALEQCKQQIGLPTALAHCAGTTLLAPLHRTTPELYRTCVTANLDSAFFMLGAFVDALREAGEPGVAVLVSSVVARSVWPITKLLPPPRRGSKDWCARQRRLTRHRASGSTRSRRVSWTPRRWRGSSATIPAGPGRPSSIRCRVSAIRLIWHD